MGAYSTGTSGVFSAHAEVVRMGFSNVSDYDGILRARGGSSIMLSSSAGGAQYSPRTRR